MSKDRKASLTKVLKFWDKLAVKVIVIDGSLYSDNSIPNNSKLMYIQNQSTYLERLRMSCELITTDYVVLACDDEIYLPSTLISCIEFLENNSDYISCCGQAVGIASLDPVPVWVDVYPKLNNFDLNDNSGIERMNKHLANYVHSSYYSVMRSKDWIKFWKKIAEIEFMPFAIQELQLEVLAAFSGKIRALSELMWIRNSINDPIREEKMPGFDPKIQIWDWWYADKFAKEKSLFISHMARIIEDFSKEKKLKPHDYNNIVEKTFQNYVNYWRNIMRPPKTKIIRNKLINLVYLGRSRQKSEYFLNIDSHKSKIDLEWLSIALKYY